VLGLTVCTDPRPAQEALPETGGKSVTYLVVMALGALAVAAGLGLALLHQYVTSSITV
jgi:LPXTG-motif cell wall-anchored protein